MVTNKHKFNAQLFEVRIITASINSFFIRLQKHLRGTFIPFSLRSYIIFKVVKHFIIYNFYYNFYYNRKNTLLSSV